MAARANARSTLLRSEPSECHEARGKLPNIILVDFHDRGDLFKVVDALNKVRGDTGRRSRPRPSRRPRRSGYGLALVGDAVVPTSSPPAARAGFLGRHHVVRRPSGNKPPLPRTVHRAAWLGLGAVALITVVWVAATLTLGLDSWLGRLEDGVVQGLVELRSDVTESIARVFGLLDQRTPVVIVTALLLVALAVLRRVQRILVLGGALLVALVVTVAVQTAIDQPRPLGVEIIGAWEGAGGPNEGLTQLAVVLVGGLVSLVPAGRPRQLGSVVVAACSCWSR